MYSRPTAHETDEDILRQQLEFKRQKDSIKLAATVVSDNKDECPEKMEDAPIVDVQDQLANTFEAVPDAGDLKIFEKKSSDYVAPSMSFDSGGFPVARRRSSDVPSTEGSIFARQHNRAKKRMPQQPISLLNESVLVSGRDRDSIHLENVKKLRSMSEKEIMEEKQRLLATMDPAIIAFLKKKRDEAHRVSQLSIEDQNKEAEDMQVEQIDTMNEILGLPQADTWLNFDKLETSKLAWMKSIETPKKADEGAAEARFDFEGWLLPFTQEITEKTRALYHHGEESGRPGYTLQELFQLSRSNVIQQKIIALNTIANLLELQSTGVYDQVLDLPIEQIFFVLRFCLDDNTPSVLNASIRAMRNLFCSKVDETCLDCLLGFGLQPIQPILAVDEEEDDDRVNDQQLAETNLVKCLARTEILTRIRYIMETVKPSVETIVYCFDILTRLCRDSQYLFSKVYNATNLIFILKTYIPNTISDPSGLPIVQAVKFLRILAARSQTIAKDLVRKHQVMDAILSYLSNADYSRNTNGLKLQIESFHLWNVFICYNLALEHFRLFQPVVTETLRYHANNTDFDSSAVKQAHVAALLIVMGSCCKSLSLVLPYLHIIEQCLVKWCTRFANLTEFSCGKLQTLSAMFYFLACFVQRTRLPERMRTIISDLLASNGFKVVTKGLMCGSMLLNNYEAHGSSANLKTVEAAVWFASEHVVPLLQSNSTVPFLASCASLIETSRENDLKLLFLSNGNLNKYLTEIRKLEKYHLTNNWFTRVENTLIMNVLKCSIPVKSQLDTRPFYEVAVKCLSIFTCEEKTNTELVLERIIFSSDYYPSEVLLKNLSLEQQNDSLAISLNNLEEISEVYVEVLGLRTNVPTFTSSLSLANQGNVIPIDWIFTPIILLYANQQQNKTQNEQDQVFIIRNCLRWILIYETYFPELAKAINATDRFCRLACVFLCSDNLFLIEEIHSLLELCLGNLVKCEEEIDFDREIQGLTSFQDFYTQLLEQYQGVSYGNVLFGNFVLAPLAQRQSSKWRKILWSEYMGVVEIFNVGVEQCVWDLGIFLRPPEEDLSLLKCYRGAVLGGSVRRHSVLYNIAKHHVDEHVASRKNKN